MIEYPKEFKDNLNKAADTMKKAIDEEIPLFFKHHADADGICAALMLEKSSRNLVSSRGANPERFIYRKPCIPPIYEEAELIKDLAFIERFIRRFKKKLPLLILIDIGADDKDTIALARSYGLDVLVIDHHPPADIDALHVNPHLFGLDNNITSGMMAAQISNSLSKPENLMQLEMISACADHSCHIQPDDVMLAKARAIDFAAYHLRTDPASEIYDSIISGSDFANILQKKVDNILKENKDYVIEKAIPIRKSWGDIMLLDLSGVHGYPPPGKLTGLVSRETEAPLVMGYTQQNLILRINTTEHDLTSISKEFEDKLGVVDFGGHAQAGTIDHKGLSFYEVMEILEKMD